MLGGVQCSFVFKKSWGYCSNWCLDTPKCKQMWQKLAPNSTFDLCKNLHIWASGKVNINIDAFRYFEANSSFFHSKPDKGENNFMEVKALVMGTRGVYFGNGLQNLKN